MYNKIVSIPTLVIGIVLLVLTESKIIDSNHSWFQVAGIIAGIILTAIGVIWLFGSLLGSMDESGDQLKRFKEILRLQKELNINIGYKAKVEKEFMEILTKTFPDFEKNLVSKFSFENTEAKEAFLAVCPKLESGSSFERYVNMLSDSMEAIKKMQIKIDEKLAEIAVYNENPWLWFKRPMPENIRTMINTFEGLT